MAPALLGALLPPRGRFQVQLEGGEPTCHPRFFELVREVRSFDGCERLVLSTHASGLPRCREALRSWVARLGEPVTIKASCNHHLLASDSAHLQRLVELRDAIADLGGDRAFVVNARFRPNASHEEASIRRALDRAGLLPSTNLFPLQRYGFASHREDWPLPCPASMRFTLVNPDGQTFGADLFARSLAMARLP